MSTLRLFLRFALVLITAACSLHAADTINWRSKMKDRAWLATLEAAQVATNFIAYQHPSGGWPKNTDMTAALSEAQLTALTAHTAASGDHAATIDNNATTPQIRFLAAFYTATQNAPARAAALRGLEYLFAAQYPNGGWPQFFPLRKGYYSHITFNDDAMVRVMELLRDIGAGEPSFAFLETSYRDRAAESLKRAIDCVLRCQIIIDGQPTVWCAQHDETTFAPAAARKFEPISFSGNESAGIVRFLMSVEKPSPEIIASVKGAVAWFERTKITGLRYDHIKNEQGKDAVVVADPNAKPLWARFYEIPSARPIFIGRDTVPHYTLAEVEQERRGGYSWYGERPAEILEKFPKWAAKLPK